jgi:hypothetical protein
VGAVILLDTDGGVHLKVVLRMGDSDSESE